MDTHKEIHKGYKYTIQVCGLQKKKKKQFVHQKISIPYKQGN